MAIATKKRTIRREMLSLLVKIAESRGELSRTEKEEVLRHVNRAYSIAVKAEKAKAEKK